MKNMKKKVMAMIFAAVMTVGASAFAAAPAGGYSETVTMKRESIPISYRRRRPTRRAIPKMAITRPSSTQMYRRKRIIPSVMSAIRKTVIIRLHGHKA